LKLIAYDENMQAVEIRL